jgi:hypothetical protein
VNTISTRRFGLALALMMVPWLAAGDAIIRSQAMFATTIAEFFVERDAVTLELEIGISDLAGFQSLLPDVIRQELGYEEQPYPERVARFLSREFLIVADGTILPGQLLEIGPGERIRRDDVTGELLATDGEPETVINAQFRWPLESLPAQVEFRLALPAAASVGFVAYHEAIAVNDFRYLVPSQVLNLDWDDPFYSAFTTRSLRRQYYAPMAGFIYVEPYEVRKEIIVRPKDIQRYVDLGLEGRDTIPIELQPELRQKVIDFLSQHHPMTIDDSPAEPAMVRADFLERTLRTSRVIDPPEELNVNAAIMGVKFIYPHEDFADSATMVWDLFDERTQSVPVSAVDPTGPLPQFLDPEFNVLEWQNFIRIPVMPELAEVRAPPNMLSYWLQYGRWVLAVLAVLLVLRLIRTLTLVNGGMAALAIVLAALGWWQGSKARLDDLASREVVQGLLTNVYRAFDFRAEGDIYDVLARSVDGNLLREVYLEMSRGLVLANQGGASARVKSVELTDLDATPAENAGISARTTWQIRAAVGHWGHIHERRNEYQANLELRPIDGAWKLVKVEILDEVRL